VRERPYPALAEHLDRGVQQRLSAIRHTGRLHLLSKKLQMLFPADRPRSYALPEPAGEALSRRTARWCTDRPGGSRCVTSGHRLGRSRRTRLPADGPANRPPPSHPP
jgi:hypothetical protein